MIEQEFISFTKEVKCDHGKKISVRVDFLQIPKEKRNLVENETHKFLDQIAELIKDN